MQTLQDVRIWLWGPHLRGSITGTGSIAGKGRDPQDFRTAIGWVRCDAVRLVGRFAEPLSCPPRSPVVPLNHTTVLRPRRRGCAWHAVGPSGRERVTAHPLIQGPRRAWCFVRSFVGSSSRMLARGMQAGWTRLRSPPVMLTFFCWSCPKVKRAHGRSSPLARPYEVFAAARIPDGLFRVEGVCS